ncbi:carbohydrate-binding domain-containing protein [Catenovulum sediminis]|uniref:carbohydrate-binding domain-containing protein n=1 Tax=Catenovulum sediminis TaxID=1740262 RepID=UPI0011815308|nr:carbohydrate-binding domain-containing protein [Catenovulum sediminis]
MFNINKMVFAVLSAGLFAHAQANTSTSYNYGVFTDTTTVDTKLETGSTSDIYIWNPNSMQQGNMPAYEGSNIISWDYVSENQWFGGGVQARNAQDMSAFEQGVLEFQIKIPADISFKVGVSDTFGNEHWIDFAAHQNQYGLIRDGEWSLVSIPVNELRGQFIALHSMKDLFNIASIDGQLPARTFSLGIDDILWRVNSNSAQTVRVEAEDYSAFFDTTAGNVGGEYRTDDVDIQSTTDTDGGFNVGWTDAGEWLEYQVELQAGEYQLTSRVASQVSGANYSVLFSGEAVGSASVDATGGWQSYIDQVLGTISVSSAGLHTMRVNIDSGPVNINWLQFDPVTACQSASCMDSDQDGVTDDIDQCPNTSAGANVSANGCEYPTTGACGIASESTTGVVFYCNASWADLHYRVNNGGQLNVAMSLNNNQMQYEVSNLNDGDQIWYYFTHENNGGAIDTEANTYTFNGTVVSESDDDQDGVNNNVDQCPNTPSGAAVDADGCEIPSNPDADNDGVIDSQDQCPNTPANAMVDSVGCQITDSDNDGVADSDDQCPNTPTHDTVDSQGCSIELGAVTPLYNAQTAQEPATVYNRGDAWVTRFSDRGRDRHAKDSMQNDHYDHYLATYWIYRTARIQIEDYVDHGGDRIDVTFITEWELGVKEFRAWFWALMQPVNFITIWNKM